MNVNCEQEAQGNRIRDRDINHHHHHKNGLRDPHSVRVLKGPRDSHSVRGSKSPTDPLTHQSQRDPPGLSDPPEPKVLSLAPDLTSMITVAPFP